MESTHKDVSEVIFEIRWGNQEPVIEGEIRNSPEYNILLGEFLEMFREDFNFIETLPSAGMPEGLSRGAIQYRLRKSGLGSWPIVQLGPGVFSVNINKDNWDEFNNIVIDCVNKFDKVSKDFKLENIVIKLTYILAKEFDFDKDDLYEFLKNKLNIEVAMGEDRAIDKMSTISFRTKIPTSNPSGDLVYLVSEGRKKNVKAIVWQSQLESKVNKILKEVELLNWLRSANLEVRKWVKI